MLFGFLGVEVPQACPRHVAAPRYSLIDVSELLGSTAPSAFSRWFRARFGVSPAEWRSRAQQVPAG